MFCDLTTNFAEIGKFIEILYFKIKHDILAELSSVYKAETGKLGKESLLLYLTVVVLFVVYALSIRV